MVTAPCGCRRSRGPERPPTATGSTAGSRHSGRHAPGSHRRRARPPASAASESHSRWSPDKTTTIPRRIDSVRRCRHRWSRPARGRAMPRRLAATQRRTAVDRSHAAPPGESCTQRRQASTTLRCVGDEDARRRPLSRTVSQPSRVEVIKSIGYARGHLSCQPACSRIEQYAVGSRRGST
jgi:hypothetical protein